MSYSADPQPLPSSPSNNYDGQGHPRANTSMSHNSRKSSGSAGNLAETHAEKDQKRLHSKADPSVAMHEAEPSLVASQQAVSLSPIRSIQHKDAQGIPISDPDKSNPTRSRWESPLQTIRSFEAAIDRGYSRNSMYRTDASDIASTHGGYSRRNSYFAGSQTPVDDRFQRAGYYNTGRAYGGQRVSSPDGYHNGSGGGGYGGGYGGYDVGPHQGNGYQFNRARMPRAASEPYNNVQGAQQSYETVTTASGSGSFADPAGYQTDPSSENSSIDRIGSVPYGSTDTYGSSGYGDGPQQPPYSPAQRQGTGYPDQGPPPPSLKEAGPRVLIKLGNSTGVSPTVEASPPPPGGKRKSWFSRRFSKS